LYESFLTVKVWSGFLKLCNFCPSHSYNGQQGHSIDLLTNSGSSYSVHSCYSCNSNIISYFCLVYYYWFTLVENYWCILLDIIYWICKSETCRVRWITLKLEVNIHKCKFTDTEHYYPSMQISVQVMLQSLWNCEHLSQALSCLGNADLV